MLRTFHMLNARVPDGTWSSHLIIDLRNMLTVPQVRRFSDTILYHFIVIWQAVSFKILGCGTVVMLFPLSKDSTSFQSVYFS